MIEPEAEIAAAITDSGRVGVLATPATVEGGAYLRALEAQGRALEVTEVAAPDLAPIIQRGFPFDEGVVEMVRSYCEPLKRAEVDTVILGCTHYPLVAPMLQRILGRDVRLVTAGHAVAAAAQRMLEAAGLATARRRGGRLPVPLHRRRRGLPRARHPLPADAARRRRAGRAAGQLSRRLPLADEHPRAGPGGRGDGDEGRRARARRRAAHARQRSAEGAKDGKGDEVAVLQRERKRRLEAAEAYREGGRDRAGRGRGAEAELIEGYLPEQLSDEELAELVDARGRGDRRQRAAGDGQGDEGADAEGRRPSRRQAGQPGGAGASLARRQLTLDNTVAAELAGSEDAVLRALEGHLTATSSCAATSSRWTATPATCRPPRRWSTSWST